jgi:preprotein translocase SecE subunit
MEALQHPPALVRRPRAGAGGGDGLTFQIYKKGQGAVIRIVTFVAGAAMLAYGCRWVYYLPGIDSLWFRGGAPVPFRLTLGALLGLGAVAAAGGVVYRAFVRGREDHGWIRWGGLTGALLLSATVAYLVLDSAAVGRIGALTRDWARLPFSWGVFVAVALFAYGAWMLFDRVINHPRKVDFLIETETELRKVAWPARHEYVGAAVVVIALALVVSLYLLGVDSVLSFLLSKIGLGF